MHSVVSYLAMLLVSVIMVSCYDEKEKALEGIWSRTEKTDGLQFTHVLRFDIGEDTNTFFEKIIPQSYNGIGFSVEGTWEIDITGGLELHYYKNTIKPVTNGFVDDFSVKMYINKVKMNISVRNNQFSKGATIPFEIKGKTLIMTTDEGKERFTRETSVKTTSSHKSATVIGEESYEADYEEGDPPIDEDDDDDW